MQPEDYINGCDFWFDGLPGMSWRHCCDLHDIAYSTGGTISMRWEADFALMECVNNVAGPMGVVMGVAVLAFGWLFYRYGGSNARNLWDKITGRRA